MITPLLIGIAIGLGIIVYVSNKPPEKKEKSKIDAAIEAQMQKTEESQEQRVKRRAESKFKEKLKELEDKKELRSDTERIEAAIASLDKEEQRAIFGSLKQERKQERKLTKKELQEMQHNYRAKEFGKTVCFTFLELLIVSSVFIFVAHQFVGVGTLESKIARWVNGL